MKTFLKTRTGTAMLGLSLDGDRLTGTLVRRTNGSAEVQGTVSATLSLSLLAGEPQLVGREIHKHLQEAGIRERRCVVCVPSSWVLTLQVPLPDLPEADLRSLIDLEAERGFPYAPETLILAESRFAAPNGERFATLFAIPREYVHRLEAVLTAAQLRPLSFSLAITSLPGPTDPAPVGELALLRIGDRINLRVAAGGGVAVLRTLEGLYDSDEAAQELQVEPLLRELRITLGQLPAGLRDAVHQLRVFGTDAASEELHRALETRLASWGITTELVREFAPGAFPIKTPPQAGVSPAVALALRHLAGSPIPFEFLPPRVSAWKRLSQHYASRRLGWVSIGAGATAALVLIAFLVQQLLLWHWGGRWQGMATEVRDLEAIQSQIRQYRPWYDESCRSLQILRGLTEAFPEEGSVAAKSIELRDSDTVTCSGTAQDRAALLLALDKLRARSEVDDLKVEQMRGRAPLEFTFNFRWTSGRNP